MVVLGGIILAAILMVEGITPEFAFFFVIFAWFPIGQIYAAIHPKNSKKPVPSIISDGGKGVFEGLLEKATLDMAAFFIIAEALKESGLLEKGIKLLIGKPQTLFQVILRLFIPCMLLSSICSNSAVVSMGIPIVHCIAELTGKWSSAVLMGPLAYAVTLGGILTLVGSPTNLQGKTIFEADGEVQARPARLLTLDIKGQDVQSGHKEQHRPIVCVMKRCIVCVCWVMFCCSVLCSVHVSGVKCSQESDTHDTAKRCT